MWLTERQCITSWSSAALALLGGLAAASAAAADPFPIVGEHSGYPLPPVGTEMVYSDGYSLTVTGVLPDSAAVMVESESAEYGVERIAYAFGIEWYSWALVENGEVVDRSVYLFDRAALADAWPLTPGFETQYGSIEILLDDDYDPVNVIGATLEVLGTERLDTPLGRLPVIEVRLTLDLGEDDFGARSTNVYARWFHPDFGLPLRMEDTFHYGEEEPDRYVFDLVSVTFPSD